MSNIKNSEHLSLNFTLSGRVPVRDYKGYIQYQEEYLTTVITKDELITHLPKTKWVFHVTGFLQSSKGQQDYCHVMMTDGTKNIVPIDRKNRITVHGKKFSRFHWNH